MNRENSGSSSGAVSGLGYNTIERWVRSESCNAASVCGSSMVTRGHILSAILKLAEGASVCLEEAEGRTIILEGQLLGSLGRNRLESVSTALGGKLGISGWRKMMSKVKESSSGMKMYDIRVVGDVVDQARSIAKQSQAPSVNSLCLLASCLADSDDTIKQAFMAAKVDLRTFQGEIIGHIMPLKPGSLSKQDDIKMRIERAKAMGDWEEAARLRDLSRQ